MAKIANSQLSCLADMQDGDVAEILHWHNTEMKPGDVIQRYGDIIILIGHPKGRAYSALFNPQVSKVCQSNKVRILQKGTLIEL